MSNSNIITETLEYTKDSKSKRYRIYTVDDKKNGIIVTMYINPSLHDNFDKESIPVKIKL